RLNEVIRNESEATARADWTAVARQSLLFHQEIVSLHGSPIFDQMFSLLVTQLRLVFVTGNEQAFHEPWLKREAEICRLIAAGDCEAASGQLENYLADSEKMLTALVRN
ncbi:FCD domain-containing protein, partial [Brucella anthropi]